MGLELTGKMQEFKDTTDDYIINCGVENAQNY